MLSSRNSNVFENVGNLKFAILYSGKISASENRADVLRIYSDLVSKNLSRLLLFLNFALPCVAAKSCLYDPLSFWIICLL